MRFYFHWRKSHPLYLSKFLVKSSHYWHFHDHFSNSIKLFIKYDNNEIFPKFHWGKFLRIYWAPICPLKSSPYQRFYAHFSKSIVNMIILRFFLNWRNFHRFIYSSIPSQVHLIRHFYDHFSNSITIFHYNMILRFFVIE